MATNPITNAKITMPFKSLTDSLLETKGQEIYASMSENIYFPNPTPDMPTLLGALTNYVDKLAAAKTRDRTAIVVKNQSRFALIELLKALGTYITFTAQGDLAMLSTTSYNIAKTRSTSPAIKIPGNVQLTNGDQSGELVSSADGVKFAQNYVHQYKANLVNGSGEWNTVFSSSRTCIIPGLIKGQEYISRIGAVGRNNQVMFSGTVTRIAQ